MPTLALLAFGTNQPNPVGSVFTDILIPSGSSRTAKGNSMVLLVIVAGVHG